MLNKNKILLTCDYIFRTIIIASIFLYVFVRMNTELHDPDVWLHLKTGEYIIQQKSVPHHDIYSLELSGKKWIDHSWLVQIIFYLVFQAGGADSLILLSALIILAAFFFLFLSIPPAYRRSTPAILLLLAVVFASHIRYNIRPENFSILFFSIYLLILAKASDKRIAFLLPVLQLIWVNCHGFFLLGPLLIALFLLGELIKIKFSLPWNWNQTRTIKKNTLNNLAAVFFLACAASFINPYGYNGVFYPITIILSAQTDYTYTRILELLPTVQFAHKYGVNLLPFYILTVASFSSFFLNFRNINIAYLPLWMIFCILAYKMNRNVLFFNFAAFLIIIENITQAHDDKIFSFIKRIPKAWLTGISCCILLTAFFWTKGRIQYLLKQNYYIFEENRLKSRLSGIDAKRLPIKAIDFMETNKVYGNIFNMFNYGAYLIYRTYPRNKVFIDGRTELYGKDFFINYQKILDNDADTIEATLKKYNIVTIFLSDVGGELIDLLSKYFFDKPDWKLIYFDKDCFIFVKDIQRNKPLIDKFKIDLSAWKVEKAPFDRLQLQDVFPEPYIKRAWKLYYLGLYSQAEAEAKEALKILSDISEPYNILGMIYTKRKAYELAFENLRLGYIYLSTSKETLLSLGDFYMATGNVAKAIEMYARMTQYHSYYYVSFYSLGKAYAVNHEPLPAINAFRQAINLRPYAQENYRELGQLFQDNKNYSAAAETYKDALNHGLNKRYFYKQLSIMHKKARDQKPLAK